MIRRLLERWRQWRAYRAELARLLRDAADSGYRVSAPAYERMRAKARRESSA